MTDLTAMLTQNAAQGWLFIPSAILLGALHGLEPGHSKTMMAAFIVAVKGTVRQAVLLGLAATLSHTLVVWLVAMGGMWLFGSFDAGASEPWFQLASGAIIVAMAVWMVWRARGDLHAAGHHHHDHGHSHHDHLDHVDAHEAAHAEDIRRRFASRQVNTPQIVLFGLTGGLVPCPGAITVLMLCLQVHRVALGAVLVAGFSMGLALTMVASGVLAALSLRHLEKRWSGFGDAVRKAPLISGLVIGVVGLVVALDGARHLL
jgi:nickel/cobalt exporter